MKLFLLFNILFITIVVINTETIYDVTKYGADAKGAQKSTEAIKKAIDEAVAKGGGTVFFPHGEYLTGPINLRSHIALHFEDKATIKFSKDHADYPILNKTLKDGGHIEIASPLIYAIEEKNITIKGKAVLDGQGSSWWPPKSFIAEQPQDQDNRQLHFKVPVELTQAEPDPRPNFIYFYECNNILIEDITVQNSPHFNINPIFSNDITIKGITIHNPNNASNTDGINCYSCKNVNINKVTINTGDDCIALNGGIKNHVKVPIENIHISDSHMGYGHSGVGIGSVTYGGVRNITVTNCVFNGTLKGLLVKTNRERGGTIENLHYSNITMNILHEGICLSMVYVGKGGDAALHAIHNITKQPVAERTPIIHNIDYKDIKGSAKYSIWFVGLPESLIENIKLTDVDIKTKEEISLTNTKNIEINGKKHN